MLAISFAFAECARIEDTGAVAAVRGVVLHLQVLPDCQAIHHKREYRMPLHGFR